MVLKLENPKVTQERYGAGHSKLYDDIKAGLFVPPVKQGSRSRWPAHETDAIIRARIAGKSDDEVRALVRDLIAARQSAA